MAKKYYDEDITLKTDWGGDDTTGNLPVSGGKVQKVIKEGINSKVGYVGYVENKSGQGFYVLTRDEDVFNKYKGTITEEKPWGDINMDGVDGRRFDAPFNYKMNITLLNPESGYKSTLAGSTGNVIKFKVETLDSNNTPQGESMTITFKVKTEGGVETTYTAIYDGNIASQGIEYNLDGKLGTGINTITITAVGMNTGISAMRRITYRSIDMYFTDKFNILKRYPIADNGIMTMTIGYNLKGVGKTKILWSFDGSSPEEVELPNLNPTVSNGQQTFTLPESRFEWVKPGLHNVQMSMLCKDTDSGEEFQTPIYYREFIIEKTPTVLDTPYIVRKVSFDADKGFLQGEDIKRPTIYNAKQFENVEIEYAAYYNGKRACSVSSYIRYANGELMANSVEELPLGPEDFSEKQNLMIGLTKDGLAEVILRANYDDGQSFDSVTNLVIAPSDMKISPVTDGLVLDLDARGRSNNPPGLDVWEYKYTDESGIEQVVRTYFSKNEYAIISTHDIEGNVIAPTDATEENTLLVDVLPEVCNEEYKYVKYNNKYYAWNREFDWSNTSGWHDNKLKLANGNAITIDYKPFSGKENLQKIKELGFTFEIEFETTNVYNDDAVICRICGNDNFAPGIVISASGAELVISRKVVAEGDNAGYAKKVSTKYKAEENNRISFVITPDDEEDKTYRNRILSIYVNGELCGAYAYDRGTNFSNDSNISFRGNDEACINISSIKIYNRALSSNDILNNYIYYRVNAEEKAAIYKRNDIVLATDTETFDSDKLKSQLPVMMIYQTNENQSLDDIHQEKKNKKLTRFFDIVYIDIQNPSKNFLVKNAYVTPQGTSSMNYPVKNLRLYTGKKNDAGEYYSKLYVGSNIFKDGSPSNLNDENINPETEVDGKRLYAFKDGSIPVNCWCLKADFAESSSSHNTGTSRYWNEVLKNAGLSTKAQVKAAKHKWGETLKNGEVREYDVRTAIDGFPIVVFYQPWGKEAPRFEGKYNFNNDKSTESVFGFTGGITIKDQDVKYFYIGKERPIIHKDAEAVSGEYIDEPTTESPLYASEILASYEKEVIDEETGEQAIDPETGKPIFEKIPTDENWYMLRGQELLDNPKMECWELLNSVNKIALFETMDGFTVGGDDNDKIGYNDEDGKFQEAFESRYPDCGNYFHYNSLKRFGEWLVSCRYLDIDDETGMAVPFKNVPKEQYYGRTSEDGKKQISICSLTKQEGDVNGEFIFDFPGYNFYKEIEFSLIESSIKDEGYQKVEVKNEDIEEVNKIAKEVEKLPEEKDPDFEYLKCDGVFYTWMPSNLLEVNTIPEVHEVAYDYIKVGDKYYVWSNKFKFADFYIKQWVEDTAFNRALKFAVEKYDHIEMDKMAAYYIYLMRFGGVDQTVKNSMLTTEGPATDDPKSTLPSLWYFINYDNDTILGVKNDGRLVFDPYITRETKDGTGYVYAGRTSTLWNNLEADVEFMDKVTAIDNQLADAEGGANPAYTLSYANALREYDTNQSDKWCERIYNKDAERKYIDTYVTGWTQKVDKDGTETHVYEDYLYDVQGSRSAHRKWWLGRRFNVFDSRFCNTNFRNQLIKFRSTNLPASSSFSITSGEPIFYAWGHDNSVSAMTPTVIQPGNTYTWTTSSAFNIGSYLELMGAANISTLDLRDCVGALTEIDITGCYSPLVGTKMKEILIGNHERTDLINVSNTSLKFSGLANASKLELLDITNIQNTDRLDGLDSLLNIREVYAKGTSISNFTFADGAMIEKIELPSTVETLSLTRSSSIKYDSIIFDGDGYGKLTNLEINDCANLMDNPDFVINWIGSKTVTQRNNLIVNLQGINWEFNRNNYSNLYLLEDVGISGLGQRNISGDIKINTYLDIEDVRRLKGIFGDECFKEGSKVYIEAQTGLYIDMPTIIWESDDDVKCEITTVGTTLSGKLTVSPIVTEIVDGVTEEKVIEATDGIITMDVDNLAKGYITVNIRESGHVYTKFVLIVTYRDETGVEMMEVASAMINKRIYPTEINVTSLKNSYNNKEKNELGVVYMPETINDLDLEGRGKFNINWEMIDGSTGYVNSLVLHHDADKETADIQAPNGFDGTVVVKATVFRKYDGAELCSATKEIEFTNPDTIITKLSNEPLYKILVSNKIIDDKTGFGKLTKTEAALLTMDRLIDASGKSIFAGNKELTSFLEFQYFGGTSMGQMPHGVESVSTPNGMFKGCTELKEIAFSTNFRYTGEEGMFEGCTSLEHIYGSYKSDDENGNPTYNDLGFIHIGNNFAKGCTNLKTCLLSHAAKHIGNRAFENCKSLEYFQLPNSSEVQIKYDKNYNPFMGCINITFNGAEYGGISTAKYQVKDGACYEVNNDKIVLIHMGKDTLMSQIPKDIDVYACPYSMENRQEENLVIPSKIIFDGAKILTASNGDSLIFENKLGKSYSCDSLLEKAKFTTFILDSDEISIPDNTFKNCEALTSIILPSSVTQIGENAFLGCNNLKDVFIESSEVTLKNINAFNGVMLDSIQVLPDYYDSYKETMPELLRPFIKPRYLYETGEVRVIKDGQIILNDGVDVIIKVGGHNITEIKGDYMTYEVPKESVTDLRVTLNEEPIGKITDRITTIYLGNNSELFKGDGLDFTYGVYNKTVNNEMEAAGWYYDPRFKGMRSGEITDKIKTRSMSFSLDDYKNKELPVIYGKYSYFSNPIYFKDDKDNTLSESTGNGFNQKTNITTESGNFKVVYEASATTKTGINGCVINKIGESIYSDPALSTIGNESQINSISVTLTCEQEIPKTVVVTVTDDLYHVYRRYWEGETLQFIVPKGYTYTIKAESFIDDNGKLFNSVSVNNIESGDITLNYETHEGITYNNGILCCSTPYYDYFIDPNRLSGTWSYDNALVENVNVDDINTSDADGYANTQNIMTTGIESQMFDTVKGHDKFGDNIQAYIPSYIDIEIVKNYLEDINEVLKNNSVNEIDFTNCWTSETYDADNAWTSDGDYKNKNEECFYYIFGRRITC